MLIVQGERDPMGGREDVESYVLSDQIQIRWIPDAGHDWSPRKRSGFTVQQNLDRAIRCVDVFINAVLQPSIDQLQRMALTLAPTGHN